MRKAFLVVGLIALLNSVPLTQTRASTATQCTGPLPPGTYSDVVVPEGHVCSLQRVIVLGNVTIERNAALQVESSTILGLLQGRGGHFSKTSQIPTGVSGGGSRIGQIDISDMDSINLVLSTVAGDVVANHVDEFFLAGVQIGGSVIADHVLYTGYPSPRVGLCQDTVGGDVRVRRPAVDVEIGHPAVSCSGNQIAGSLVVSNQIPLPIPGLTTELSVSGNTVNGDARVDNNRGPGRKQVMANTVGGTLTCINNDEPFTGGPNTATRTKGQCF